MSDGPGFRSATQLADLIAQQVGCHNHISDGGPAFPTGILDTFKQPPQKQFGMSLRDYFAAHAPAEPQPWFNSVVMPPRPEPRYVLFAADGKTIVREFKDQEEAEKFAAESYDDANYQAVEAWREEWDKQRLVQWPFAWADEMIKRRT